MTETLFCEHYDCRDVHRLVNTVDAVEARSLLQGRSIDWMKKLIPISKKHAIYHGMIQDVMLKEIADHMDANGVYVPAVRPVLEGHMPRPVHTTMAVHRPARYRQETVRYHKHPDHTVHTDATTRKRVAEEHALTDMIRAEMVHRGLDPKDRKELQKLRALVVPCATCKKPHIPYRSGVTKCRCCIDLAKQHRRSWHVCTKCTLSYLTTPYKYRMNNATCAKCRASAR
jgi:hypothetical protein